MKRIYLLGFLSVLALLGFVAFDYAFAEETNLVQGVKLSSNQAVTIVVIGIAAGFLVAYQGYRTTPEDFDKLKFFDGVIYSVIGSVPLAIGASLTVNLDVFGYVTIFFAAIGIGSQIKKTRQKTIPSNATDEQTENIIGGE